MTDMFNLLELPLPQSTLNIRNHLKQHLDQIEYLPLDVTNIIADYYSPYMYDYKFIDVSITGRLNFDDFLSNIDEKELKVVAVKHKKDENITITTAGLRMLPDDNSILAYDCQDHILKTFGPCDLNLTGYNNPEEICYFTFSRRTQIVITVDQPTTIQLVCL